MGSSTSSGASASATEGISDAPTRAVAIKGAAVRCAVSVSKLIRSTSIPIGVLPVAAALWKP